MNGIRQQGKERGKRRGEELRRVEAEKTEKVVSKKKE
jgi:hypothetical protein